MGDKTFVVSLTCSKRIDTMVKLCEVFESLKLKIIAANITSFSGTLLKTVFIEVSFPFFPFAKFQYQLSHSFPNTFIQKILFK